MERLFRFPAAIEHDPAVDEWLEQCRPALRPLAARWLRAIRDCGPEVRELIHDGHPTACVLDAAFAYVDAFSEHVNVGFFHGSALPDPAGLLQGSGKHMRHVKVLPGEPRDERALEALIEAAHADMWMRLDEH